MISPFAMTNCSSRFLIFTPTFNKSPPWIQVNSEPVSTRSCSTSSDLSGAARFSTVQSTRKTPMVVTQVVTCFSSVCDNPHVLNLLYITCATSVRQHRSTGNRLNDREIDRQQDHHYDPTHHHKDRRLKRGPQLL